MRRLIRICSIALLATSVFGSNLLSGQANRTLSATVVSGKPGLYRIDWGTGAIRTINRTPLNAVHGAHDNQRDLVAGPSGPIMQTAIFNLLTTIAGTSGPVNGFAPDQDDAYWVANGADRIGYLWRGGFSVRHYLRNGWGVNAVCRDGENASVVAGCSDGTVVTVDRTSRAERVIATSLGSITSIAWLDRDLFVVGRSDGADGLVMIDGNGRIVRTIPFKNVQAITVDEQAKHFYAANGFGVITQFDFNGQAIFSRNFGRGASWTGLDVYANRPLSASTDGPGFDVDIQIQWSARRQMHYCLCLSMARSPGIKLTNDNYFRLATDALFWLTLCAGTQGSTGFRGQLDIFGTGRAKLMMDPRTPPLTLHLCALVENPNAPAGYDVTNVVPFRTRL